MDTSVKQLAQARPSGTTAVSAIKRATKSKLVVTSIIVCNSTGSSANYSIYIDKDGTTYSEATALYFSTALAANTTALLQFDGGLPIDSNKLSTGNLAVQSSTANAITFTINGIEL